MIQTMSNMEVLYDFEKPIGNLEKKLQDLKRLSQESQVDLSNEIGSLEQKLSILIEKTHSNLTPWQRVLLSRHPKRPYTLDYLSYLFPDFQEIHGDRCFGDDHAIVAGVASWPPVLPSHSPTKMSKKGQPINNDSLEPSNDQKTKQKGPASAEPRSILILGHQKGRTTQERMRRNFAMARPEGYRKAIRLMKLAARFQLPILSLIDTPGAFAGVDAEERGQSQAIAESILTSFQLKVPMVSIVIGEGGSGGALAIGVCDRVFMLKNSIYSVISPESCASILWNDSSLAQQASDQLKMSSSDLFRLGIIDGIIDEPLGGAHRDPKRAAFLLGKTLTQEMTRLIGHWKRDPEKQLRYRHKKFRAMGQAYLSH